MKRYFLSALLILALSSPAAFAGENKNITLKDGSVIKGDLVSFENGIYTVQTENLGTLQLPEANVVSVAVAGFAPVAAAPAVQPAVAAQPSAMQGGAGFSGQVTSMQNQIMSNPQTMEVIQAMAEDPEISKMMADPALMQALTAAMSGGDPQEIANNPQIQKLMSNPKIQALVQQIQGGTPQ